MDKIYAELNLLRYYYSETDLFETLEIEHALEEDVDLRFEYKMIRETLGVLPSTRISPSQNVLNKILSHSKISC